MSLCGSLSRGAVNDALVPFVMILRLLLSAQTRQTRALIAIVYHVNGVVMEHNNDQHAIAPRLEGSACVAEFKLDGE